MGTFWLLAAILFLSCNSALMHEGAMAYANTDRLKLILGSVALSTPWILAVLPFQAGISMRPTWFGLRRPTAGTLVVIAAYGVFILYNVLNGSNALTSSRVAVVAEKQHGVDSIQALKDQRAALRKEQEALPPYRPASAVAALIAAEKQSKRWKTSGECKDATNKASRDYCAGVQKMEAELATAVAGGELISKVTALDQKLSETGAISAETDPQAEALAHWIGTTPSQVRSGIGMLGPVALEFGALVFLAFSGRAFGWKHTMPVEPQKPVLEPVFNPAPLMSPEAAKRLPVAPLEELTAQRKLAEWFFKECTRPCPAGSMTEEEWYEHYANVCRNSHDKPLPLDAFRRIASRFIPRIGDIDGQTHYFERLPLVPAEA